MIFSVPLNRTFGLFKVGRESRTNKTGRIMLMNKNDKKRIDKLLGEYYRGNLPEGLDETLRGWLVSDDHRDGKDLSLSEMFFRTVKAEKVPDQNTIDSLIEVKKILKMFPENQRNAILDSSQNNAKAARKRMALRVCLRVAAVLIPAIMSVGVYMALDRATLATPEESWITVAAGPDAAHVKLPDSSEVTLYSGTIGYPENFGGERRVRLDGKANFQVAKAEGRTFTVESKHFSIEVLGTIFTVNSPSDAAQSTVDLYHGSVRVVAGGKEYTLEPGRHFEYTHSTGEATVTMIPLGGLTYETMPGLTFDGQSLQQIFDALSEQYNIRFDIRGDIGAIGKDVRVDLTGARSIEEVMNILSTVVGFGYQVSDEKVIVTVN